MQQRSKLALSLSLKLNSHRKDLGMVTLSRLVFNPYYELGHKKHPF
jgi:hypothetical protein